MADIARRGSRPQFVVPVTFALVVILAAACSTPAVSPSPTPVPTPVPTVDPHLGDPASAQAVFNGLGREGLKIVTNTAEVGAAGTAVITRINATYSGWPLEVVEYRTTADLAKTAAAWKAGQRPGNGEPPVALAGANILIRWGPWARNAKPPRPDERQTAALEALVAALDRLLSPLRSRANVPVQTVSVPLAIEDGPSAAPEATPAP
jgi:hypothetical protein